MFAQGRLTVTSGQPVGSGELPDFYYTPYTGNKISIYNGTRWMHYTFTERTFVVNWSGTTPRDVFIYDNAGTLTLEVVAWSTATARATAITLLDGSYVKDGDNTRLYLGTVILNGIDWIQEDQFYMGVWNNYNRVERRIGVQDVTNSWTTTATTFESLNTNNNNRVIFVRGLNLEPVHLTHTMFATSAGDYAYPGIALDATNTTNALIRAAVTATTGGTSAASIYNALPGIGYHYLQLTQRTLLGTTVTLYGDNGQTFFQTGGEGHLYA
jgi:hypothetical protein